MKIDLLLTVLMFMITCACICMVVFINCNKIYDAMLPGMTIYRIDRLLNGSFFVTSGVVVVEGDKKYFVNSYTDERILITIRDIYNGQYRLSDPG